MAIKDLRINEQIRVREVRLIDGEGEQRGVIATADALVMAKESDLDLVEVAPTSRPPVCKLLNYGKYKYEMEKKSREAKKKQTLTKMKEVRMQPKIDKHDLDFKARHVQEFLNASNKCKVTIRFRGRELAHTELGKVVLDNLLKRLEEGTYNIDNHATMEGRMMSMLLSPRKK